MPGFIEDRSLRFPRRPRLAPDLEVFEMPEGLGIQIRGAGEPVLLRGRLADTLLPWLLKRLDGEASAEEILRDRPPEIREDELADALVLLLRKGVLVDGTDETGAPPAAHDDPVRARQLLFFGRTLGLTRSSGTAQEVEARLARARVVILGDGLFGAAAFDVLQRSGCTDLRVLDWEGDGSLSAAVRQSPHSSAEVVGVERDLDRASAALDPLLPGADLLVTATRNAPEALLRAINQRALEARRGWLRGDESAGRIEIGPYVNGTDSACFTCLCLRGRATEALPIEEQLYQDRLEAARGPEGLRGEWLAHAAAGGALLAAEAIRILTFLAPPLTDGAVLDLSLEHGFSRHAFLRVPRCPDCYRGDVGVDAGPR